MKHLALHILFSFLLGFSILGQEVVINEIQNRNYSTVLDEDQDIEDWVELKNTGNTDLSLLGYGLSDDQSDPFKWIFPDIVLPAQSYLIVFLSGKDRNDPLSELHTNYSLSQTEPLILFHPDLGLSDLYPPIELTKDASYGRTSSGNSHAYFGQPTPGAPNLTQAYSGICPAPVLSHNSGFYTEAFQVSISGESETIQLFTLDGSEPTTQNVIEPEFFLYKNNYPFYTTDPFGEFLEDSMCTFEYLNSITIEDRSAEPDRISQKASTNRTEPDYFPTSPSFKGTVVRARSTAPDMLPSEIISKVYFVTPEGWNRYNLPVVSMVIGEDELFDYNKGIHTAGQTFDNWRTLFPNEFPAPIFKANYGRRGMAWEKPVWFELLDTESESVLISTEVGARMHGASSRRFARKSFRLYARGIYGTDSFDHPLFDNHHTNSFERIILKNGGSDESITNMRDALIQEIAKPMNAIVSGSRPTFLFLNGEFYGLNTIREVLDDNYFKERYGLEKEHLDLIEGMSVAHGSEDRFNEVTDHCWNADYQNESEMSQLSNYVDLESFLDVFVVNFITANSDMLPKNTFWWRDKNPLSGDDRFYSALVDQDRGLGFPFPTEMSTPDYDIVSHFLVDTEETITTYLRCFLAAILNDGFQRSFLNRSADVLNTYFTSERVVEHIDSFQEIYEPHYEEHIDRWSGTNNIQSLAEWQIYMAEMTNFATARPDFHRQHLSEHFETDGTYEVALDVSDAEHGYIHLNSIDVNQTTEGIVAPVFPWEGIYFRNVEIDLTAVPHEGFIFSHWEGELSGNEITMSSAFDMDSVYIKAIFTPDTALSISAESKIQRIKVFPNPSLGSYSIEEDAQKIVGYFGVDLIGRKILEVTVSSSDDLNFTIQDSPGVYMLVVQYRDGSEGKAKLMKQ